MKKIFIKSSIIIMCLCCLTCCSREEYIDLSGFVNSFSRNKNDISLDDFYYEESEKNEKIYYTFFENENTCILLNLICNKENKIQEMSVFIPKNSNSELSSQDILLFNNTSVSALSAFTGYDEEEAESILREMYLYDKNTYITEGELTKKKDNLYFRYFSTSSGSRLSVLNTYLKEIEETEKPKSKPVYGDTTNIRQERSSLE